MRITVSIGDICIDLDDESSDQQSFEVTESILRRAATTAIATWVELHSIGFEFDSEDEETEEEVLEEADDA